MAKLTARFLESAKGQTGRRLEWADDGQRGLYFRCTAAGEKAWSVRYRLPDGSQRRLTIGTFPEMSLADARNRAMKELAKVGDGRDPVAETRKVRREARHGRLTKPQTFDALWSRYEKATSFGKRPSTTKYKSWLYARHVAPKLGSMKLVELDRATLREAVREIGAKAPVTANRAQALIAAVFNWAVEEELAPGNPVSGMPRLFPETSRARVLRDQELKAVWNALSTAGGREDVNVSSRMCLALKLTLLTLARGNDVAGLHAREIDPATRTWTIPGDRAKGRLDHSIPLSPPAWNIVTELLGANPSDWSGYAFPHGRRSDAPMERHSLTRAMARIAKAYKLEDATPHDFRRTAATVIASERIGAPPHIVSALLAHKPEGPAVTQVYNRHRYDAEKRRALDAWAESLVGSSMSRTQNP